MAVQRKLTEDEKSRVVENIELVHYVLQKHLHMKPYMDDYQDYFQVGCIGLIYAVIRFKDEYNYSFSTYAVPNIRGHIQRYKRENSTLHIPRNLKDKYYETLKLQSQGYTMDEIPEQMGITSMQLLEIVNAYSLTSLNMEVSGDEGDIGELGNIISDWKNSYEDLIFEKSFDEVLNQLLSSRKERDKAICEEWIYANMFGEKLNQKYFAKKYGMSQCHVSRILKRFKDDLLFYLDFKLEDE